METEMLFKSSRLVERRLRRASATLRDKNEELRMALDQYEALDDDANDKEVRALVAETPLAEHEHRESKRHREAMDQHIAALREEIVDLESEQDRLLDQLHK
jgi:chromosome segregation ATPase